MARTHLSNASRGVVGGLDKNVITEVGAKLDDFDNALDSQMADVVPAVAGTAVAVSGIVKTISFLLGDVAGTSKNDFVMPEKGEIIAFHIIKDGAGAANTVQLNTSADVAITDAIAAAVDKTVTRAATIDKATRVIAAGGTVRVTSVKSAGVTNMAGFISYLPRA